MNKFTLSALAFAMTLGLAACSSEDEGADFDQAADNAEEMMDDAGDAAENTYEDATGQSAWEQTEDAVEDTAEEVGEAAEEAGEAMEEGYDEATQ